MDGATRLRRLTLIFAVVAWLTVSLLVAVVWFAADDAREAASRAERTAERAAALGRENECQDAILAQNDQRWRTALGAVMIAHMSGGDANPLFAELRAAAAVDIAAEVEKGCSALRR